MESAVERPLSAEIRAVNTFPHYSLPALMQKKTAYAVFAGFILGISVLAGHPQTSHGMVFVLVVHTVYRTAAIYVKERNKNIALYAAAMLAVCLGMAVLIAAAQIMPTYELVKESTRGSAVAFDFAAKSAQLSLRHAVLLIVPNYFGALTRPYWGDIDISQNIFYIGVVPLLLAGLALVRKGRNKDILYFSIMAVFFLLVALGNNGPVFSLLYQYLPGFKYFRGGTDPVRPEVPDDTYNRLILINFNRPDRTQGSDYLAEVGGVFNCQGN